jgi:hypothetical protein
MKLPDFTVDESLNELRRLMKATLRDFVLAPTTHTLTPEEIERLTGEGIEIPIEDVRVLNDGTYVYKGRRVIVHIRDVEEYGGRDRSLPRFHLAMCETLEKMIEEGRYKKRYVVSARDDGLFKIFKIRNGNIDKSDEALDVCQNCLDELRYKGFFRGMNKHEKRTRVHEFLLQTFFEEYGRSCVWAMPNYDSTHAPPNIYSTTFFRIARTIKEQRGYRCENPKCRIDLSKPANQKFLHAHHLDADKSDSHPRNIKLLCIRCHADSFQHSHLKQSPDYKKFCVKF